MSEFTKYIDSVVGNITRKIEDEFNENDHPRDNGGKFTSAGGEGKGGSKKELVPETETEKAAKEELGEREHENTPGREEEESGYTPSEEDLRHLGLYASYAYNYINKYLRGLDPGYNEGLKKEIQEHVEGIDRIISNQTQKDILHVSRACTPAAVGLPIDANTKQMKSVIGKVFQDNAYMSTTYKEESGVASKVAGRPNVNLKLTVPPGKGRGVDVYQYDVKKHTGYDYSGEQEYLLKRGTKYKITSVVREYTGKFKYTVYAEVVD